MGNGRSVAEGPGDFESSPGSGGDVFQYTGGSFVRDFEVMRAEISTNVVADIPQSSHRRYLRRFDPPWNRYQAFNAGLFGPSDGLPTFLDHLCCDEESLESRLGEMAASRSCVLSLGRNSPEAR